MKKLIFLAFTTLNCFFISAQCVVNPIVVSGPVLASSGGGTSFRSSLIYNPINSLYYSLNGGSPSYPLDVFDFNGNLIQSNASGADFRGGFWHNSTLMAFGNQFNNNPVVEIVTDGNGLPTGVSNMFTLNPAPTNIQACASYDEVTDEIIIWNGVNPVVFYSAVTGNQTRTLNLTGIPVALANINTTSIVNSGCTGSKLGLYDFVNGSVLWFNESTGAFVFQTPLGQTFPNTNYQKFAYANDLVWLYDTNANVWRSFDVFSPDPSSIPTMSQWGLMILCLLIFITSMLYFKRGQIGFLNAQKF